MTFPRNGIDPRAADPAREQRLEDQLPEDLAQVARQLPAIPRDYSILRRLLALLPNPLAAGLRAPTPAADLTPQPPPTAMSQMAGYGGGIVGNGPGTVPGTAITPGSINGGVAIAGGSLPATTFDITPPAVPTGLALTSDLVQAANGELVVRIVATLVHPSDTDYFGSWIELTADNDGAGGGINPNPIWTQPLKHLLGKESTKVSVVGVAGNTKYWARAFSVDVQGNKSAYTGTVTVTTAKDVTALAVPQGFAVVAGFRGVACSWNAVSGSDLHFYQLRYRPTGSSSDYVVANIKATVAFVANLNLVSYDFAVRAIDLSGNVATSDSDPTPLSYTLNPDAGYTAIATATPTLVGSADIAANSVTAAQISTAGLSADAIKGGTLALRPSGAVAAIQIYDANNVLLGSWDPTNGLTLYDPADASNYAVFASAMLSFYQQGVLNAQIGPAGILADSIRLGTLSGGHNLVANSSFELAAFVVGVASAVFTDNTGTPAWKAANRIVAIDNMTEGATTLTPTTVAF